MAIIDLKTWLSSTKFVTATYDDATGNVTLNIATALTKDEDVIKEIILAIEDSAKSKRTTLNSPISQKSFEDNPKYQFVTRFNADNTSSELQVEYYPQLSLWLKSPDLTTLQAVNDND
jgi:hypothetical protein